MVSNNLPKIFIKNCKEKYVILFSVFIKQLGQTLINYTTTIIF